MPLITATRIRRAADGVVLAERLEEPLTPVRWAGAEPGEHTVYAEAQTAGGAVFRSAPFAFDTALFSYRAGDDIAAKGGTFSRASTGSYRDAGGIIQEAALNALRDAHYVRNPVTGLYERSTLLEGQRTNLLVDPIIGDQWGRIGMTVTPVVDTRMGAAFELRDTPEEGYHVAYLSHSIFSDTDERTISIYAKAGTRRRVSFGMRGGAFNASVFDLVTGTVVSTYDAHKARIEPVGEGWYRLVVSTPPAVVAWYKRFSVGILPDDAQAGGSAANVTWLGDGNGTVYVAMPQAEAAPFASSYIPTSGSPVTRAADSLTFAWPHEPQPMTAYARFRYIGAPKSARLFQIGSADDSPPKLMVYSGSDDGGLIRVSHSDGESTLATVSGSIEPGALTEIRFGLNEEGRVFLGVASNHGDEDETVGGSRIFADAWSGEFLRIGSRGSTQHSFMELTHVRIEPGVHDLSAMRAAAGVPNP